MDAQMAQLLTLAVDIDVLLASGSPADEAFESSGPEPSFTYASGERPSSASASPSVVSTGKQLTSNQHAASNGCPSHLRYAWLRPGVRRFLLAVNPYFKTVLLVRSRCSSRRCSYCLGSARRASIAGGHCISISSTSGEGDSSGDIGSLGSWERGVVGGCGAALLTAALPHLDPDGQFFSQRFILFQDPARPRTAHPKLTRSSCPGDTLSPPRTPRPMTAVASANVAVTQSSSDAFPAQRCSACDLCALATALGERPSAILVVTTADRAVFGGLADQVVQCQPYRKEYGKYDDVLDCLESVVSGLLAEPSVPVGIRRLGLLHSKLQPSPMMQALHAQAALRRAQQLQQRQLLQQPQQQPLPQQQLTVQVSGGRRAQAALGTCSPKHSQQRQLQQQPPAAVTRKGASVSSGSAAVAAKAASPKGSGRRSGGFGRRETEDGGSAASATRGVAVSTISAPQTSPLPPIPELPLLEVGAGWPGSDAEGEEGHGHYPSAPVLGGSTSSSNCLSGSLQTQVQQETPEAHMWALSPVEVLCTSPDSVNSGGGPNRSSAGSSSSCGSGSNTSSPAMAAATPPLLYSGRRMAWDAVPISPSSFAERIDSSAASAIVQNLRTLSQGQSVGAVSSGGGVFGRRSRGSGSSASGGGSEFDWRPSSFPAATKPHVTRYISDCASPAATAAAAAVGLDAATSAAVATPASPLSAAASVVATATSRLFSRILGARRRRRCRPSDAGNDSSVGGVVAAAARGSRAWSVTGEEGSFLAAVAARQHLPGPTTAAEAAFMMMASGGPASCPAAAQPSPPPRFSDNLSPQVPVVSASSNDCGSSVTSPAGPITDAEPTLTAAWTVPAATRPAAAPIALSLPSPLKPQLPSPWVIPSGDPAGCRLASPAAAPAQVTVRGSLPGTALMESTEYNLQTYLLHQEEQKPSKISHEGDPYSGGCLGPPISTGDPVAAPRMGPMPPGMLRKAVWSIGTEVGSCAGRGEGSSGIGVGVDSGRCALMAAAGVPGSPEGVVAMSGGVAAAAVATAPLPAPAAAF